MDISRYEWIVNGDVHKMTVPELGLILYINKEGDMYRGYHLLKLEDGKVSDSTDLFSTVDDAKTVLVTNLLTGFMKVQTKLMASITRNLKK